MCLPRSPRPPAPPGDDDRVASSSSEGVFSQYFCLRRRAQPRTEGRGRAALVAGIAALAAIVASASAASAYCRTTTTCDACFDDPKPTCFDAGPPLYWGRSCVSFSVQKDGSQIASYAVVQKLATQAFLTWELANCPGGDGPPSILVDDAYGAATCHRHEYNIGQGNANIIMIYDHDFPFAESGALAVTTVIFNSNTGEIYDADMEIDASDPISKPISAEPFIVPDKYDLQSIMTHEAGHFLGLAHAHADGSIMHEVYDLGSSLRELGQDDIDGICAVYPPTNPLGKCDFAPRHGFSPDCAMATSYAKGCAITGGPAKRGGADASAAVLGAFALAGWASARRSAGASAKRSAARRTAARR